MRASTQAGAAARLRAPRRTPVAPILASSRKTTRASSTSTGIGPSPDHPRRSGGRDGQLRPDTPGRVLAAAGASWVRQAGSGGAGSGNRRSPAGCPPPRRTGRIRRPVLRPRCSCWGRPARRGSRAGCHRTPRRASELPRRKNCFGRIDVCIGGGHGKCVTRESGNKGRNCKREFSRSFVV